MNTFSRRSRRRTLTALLAAGALAGSLVACAGGGSPGTTAPEDIPAEGVDDGSTLTLWTRAPLEKQAKLLVEAYNDTHENQVELTVVPNDDYVAKVGAAAGSGGLPDLFAADIVYVPNWVEQGLFQDISAQIDGLDFKDQINKGHLNAGTVDGKEHVLPFVLDLSMLFWNKELFEEAGLDPEKAPADLEEFAAAAKAIQALDKPDVYGTATGLNCGGCLVFTWFPTVWADGEDVLSDDGTESLLASDTAKEVYATWKDLWDSGAVLPSSQDEAGPTWTAGFTEGKVGLMYYPATLLSSTPFDAGVAGIAGPDGGASTFVGGDGIGISKDSKQSPQAWNFLNWLMSEDAQVGVLAKNKDVVSRADFSSNEFSDADPRLVTINEVAGQGDTPVALNFQQAFNAPGSPWLTLVRNAVLGDDDSVDADNDEITAVLQQ
ncbi:sugar ABC transporter substrate-binding protein [Microbacterium sp. EYE_5]|uniref:ABC transporter substrate-binding protein n=1 Tax=unclassified Microbacterium TaxID=2609290 RepID=UPI0020045A26|nr:MULTISPECIES: sugar ABC transporter substrate-binding protein [unclassified Microbacterium]MCK6080239.1 sugar ABC transporter substrate-binding protein [Microbacterium sp. EYE_382]MCK6085510.1 sugar ABC transporter substrate-binding protein [Microbacterium sp. EYE_384]MCK6122265.1 sugar ABC transporter substrate-binding protein [Microbacterium sp. EYE_80]MCK6126273.1 sugar ABC transporter substrate-binding protein [Microbacterium sp. EYE_79]MCK6141194.1 sugar ABC transporter substrate-bindi